jgi:hypothetical protein
VGHHLGAGDAAAEIDAGDHVEWRHRIAGRCHNIEGRKHIGDNLATLVDRDRRRRAFLHPEPFGAGIDDRHDRGREPFAQLALFSQR